MYKPKILIVEDEIIVALNLRNKLMQHGYNVVDLVSTGEESIAVAEASKPDLILMDIRLKGDMDGIDAATEIRSKLDVPIIFLTAYIDEITKGRAESIASNYLHKPFDASRLYDTIDATLMP